MNIIFELLKRVFKLNFKIKLVDMLTIIYIFYMYFQYFCHHFLPHVYPDLLKEVITPNKHRLIC